MITDESNPSERLFADLCNRQYLKGFVFHSPKYNDPTEKEAGDVVLWVRNMMVVFEIVWRNPASDIKTKQFVKRIGEKRDQLNTGFSAYSLKGERIRLVNEEGNTIKYQKDCFQSGNYVGVVVVDCDSNLEKIHYETYKKSLNLPFSNAILTKRDFLDLIVEIDTVSDLIFYLKDRFEFVKSIYSRCPGIFLDLNNKSERDLVGLYKMGENSFSGVGCNELLASNSWDLYRSMFCDKIKARDSENNRTKIIDDLIDLLLHNHSNEESTLLHAWELGIRTRRERVGFLADKISDAIERMKTGNEQRQFAFYSQVTGCWSVFYFQYGEKQGELKKNLVNLTQLKLLKEIKENAFEHSVFGYGFRKSSIDTGNFIDEINLCIEDAENYDEVSDERYEEAKRYFGKPNPKKIREFPQ